MRVLTRREKIEYFLVAPLLFYLWLVLFVYSLQHGPFDAGYLVSCFMISVGSAFNLSRNGSLLINLLVTIGGFLVTQFAFFGREAADNYPMLGLQYFSIYLLSLTAITNINWFLRGKPVKS